MYLLKLQMDEHGNSIYFMRDNMVCFPKSGSIKMYTTGDTYYANMLLSTIHNMLFLHLLHHSMV